MRDYATDNKNGSGLRYRIEYAPASSTQSDWKPGMVNVYEDVELTGSFANWNEDRSSNVGFQAPGAVVVHSLDEAIRHAKRTRQLAEGPPEAFVIGGEAIFREALPSCARLYLTRVHPEADGDVRFPEIDSAHWESLSEESRPADAKNDHAATFTVYERVKQR